MKSLEDHNAERQEHQNAASDNSPRPNDIACPTCGKELVDTNPLMTFTSDPPQKSIRCPACGYTGYRIA